MSEAANNEEISAGGGAWLTSREVLLLLTLAGVQFTHIVDFMIIMPLGPIFLAEMGLKPWQFGAVVSAYTISAGIGGLLAAQFLDQFDRKTALLGLYAGFIVGTLACAIAPNFPLLLAARTVAGAFGGVVAAVVLVIVGDAFHDKRRATAMGVVMSAFSVASIAGVPLGLLLAEASGWRSTFVVLGGVSMGVFGLAAVSLRPMRGHLSGDNINIGNALRVLLDPNHVRAFALSCSLVFTSFLLAPFMATFLKANIGLEQADLKYIYLCGGLVTVVTMTLIGWLADRFGKLQVFRILAMFTIVPIVLLTNLPPGLALPLVLIVTTAFIVATSGRMVPAMALIAGSAAPAQRGSFMSYNSAIQQMGAGVATSLAGLLLGEGEGNTLLGFPLVGGIACLAALASVFLAGRLRNVSSDSAAPERGDISAAEAEDPGLFAPGLTAKPAESIQEFVSR